MNRKIIYLFLFIIQLLNLNVIAQVIYVQNDEQLKSAVSSVQPGDTIVIRDGAFDTDGSVTIRKNGTPENRIIIKSESHLGTEFINESYFDFRKCSFITLSGFIFSSDDVTAVKLQASNNIRITNNVFKINETESTKWVYIGGIWDDAYTYSHDNRIDHNIFKNKTQPGNFITIDGSSEPTYQVSQRDTIDHNLFVNNNPRAENEKESIRIGWSELSMSSGFTVVENNLFVGCNGDPEIISVKTCDNIIRNNTFRGSKGTLSLRHGNRTAVYGNFFFGENVEGTGGIRVYGDDHVIYNNYFEGLKGTKWDAPITLTNGDYDGGSNYSKHFRINRVKILFNTLVNNTSGIEIGFTNSGKYSKPPRDVIIANNLIVSPNDDLVKIISDPINMKWRANIFYPSGTNTTGFDFVDSQAVNTDPLLIYADSLWRLSEYSPAIDFAAGDYPFVTIDVDGQSRTGILDVGADEFSNAKIENRPLTESDVGPVENDLTGIENDKENLLSDYTVKQNYPNPFNSTTTIEYYIPQKSSVKIKIFDILGNVLVNSDVKIQSKGNHKFIWNTSSMNQSVSSGVYVFQIQFKNISKFFKMIYLK